MTTPIKELARIYFPHAMFEEEDLAQLQALVDAAVAESDAERMKQEPIPSHWDCGCGWHNSLEFATCAACSRTPFEGNAVWRYKKEPAPVPDDNVPAMAKVLMGFLAEQSYLHHPSVPYNGTENGDSPAAWHMRLYETAVKAMLKAAQGE